MPARSLLLLLVFASLAPAAGAAVPVADPNAVIVTWHGAYDSSTGTFCSSSDPFIAVASTDLTSRLSAMPAGPGLTAFTLHLDPTVGDPVNGRAACGAIDLTFTSDIAWPLREGWNVGSFSATCGLTGVLYAYGSSTASSFQLSFGPAPAGCALPIPHGVIPWSVTPPHGETALACSPLVVSPCVGVYAETYPGFGCGGRDASRLYVTAGLTLAVVERSCHFWSDGREHVVVSDGFAVVSIDATSDSCAIIVADPLGAAGSQSSPCPEGVGDLVYGTDWTHVLP